MNYPTQEGLRALGITVREHYDESGVTLQDARRIIDWHNAQAAKQEPSAWWIPKAEQFAIMERGSRPFAKAWQPLYAAPKEYPWLCKKSFKNTPCRWPGFYRR